MNPFHILFYDRYKQFRARRLSSINPIEETLPHIFGLFRNNSRKIYRFPIDFPWRQEADKKCGGMGADLRSIW